MLAKSRRLNWRLVRLKFLVLLLEAHTAPDLEREKDERKEGEASVAVFKRQLASLHERCAAIDLEIDQYRALVGNLRRGEHYMYSATCPWLIPA
jgi:hypothetical protein